MRFGNEHLGVPLVNEILEKNIKTFDQPSLWGFSIRRT
jgi:hypothetical protein